MKSDRIVLTVEGRKYTALRSSKTKNILAIAPILKNGSIGQELVENGMVFAKVAKRAKARFQESDKKERTKLGREMGLTPSQLRQAEAEGVTSALALRRIEKNSRGIQAKGKEKKETKSKRPFQFQKKKSTTLLISMPSKSEKRGGKEKSSIKKLSKTPSIPMNSTVQKTKKSGLAKVINKRKKEKEVEKSLPIGPHLVIQARAGTGKCLGKGTPVLMHNGTIKKVERIEAGDVLMGPDSKPRTVLSTASGKGMLYRIIPNKGDSWVCNGDHILTLCGTNHVNGKVKDISVIKYLSNIQKRVPNANCWKLFRTEVTFQKQANCLPVPPYLVGLWLGDGTRGTCQLTNGRQQIHNYCRKVANKLNLKCKITEDKRADKNTSRIDFVSCNKGDKGQVTGGNRLLTFFKTQCLANGLKKIPHDYLTTSTKSRKQLLAGIIDTDGESTGTCNTFVTVSGKHYRDGLLFLARSLGFAAYATKRKTYVCKNGRISNYYSVAITGNLCDLPTKVRGFPPRKQIKRFLVTGFQIEAIGAGKYFGFTLAGDGRFLLGDFTVTHNTTSLVEGLKLVVGKETTLSPSPQQRAIWDAMRIGRKPASVCFVAFNKSIAEELKARVPDGCDAMTMHAMGFRAVCKAFPDIQIDVSSSHPDELVARVLGKDIWKVRRENPDVLRATTQLVDLCKMNLVGPCPRCGGPGCYQCDRGDGDYPGFDWQESLLDLASYYDIDLNGRQETIFTLVPQVLELSKDVVKNRAICYADMIWLPIVLGIAVRQYDLLLIDEAQDLNRCQQALARKAGKRLIFCGDSSQALYGFAGADTESLSRMEEELDNTDVGCMQLPLTVTRRCCKAVVREAQKYVPDFEAHESNPEGSVTSLAIKDYDLAVKDGDMILCRVNAPLVSECFRFLANDRKATIQGRDIGDNLIRTVKKVQEKGSKVGEGEEFPYNEMTAFQVSLREWYSNEIKKEEAKRNPSESKLINIRDRYDCIACFCVGKETVMSVIDKILAIFTDEKNGIGIRLSSVHKAKGLEASRVFILQPEGATMPHPMARTPWQQEQELNILYVAITRAKNELFFVS